MAPDNPRYVKPGLSDFDKAQLRERVAVEVFRLRMQTILQYAPDATLRGALEIIDREDANAR